MIALHGFGLGPGAFDDVGALLPWPLHAPLLPGHGAREAMAFDDVVDDLCALVRARGAPLVLWGYSLGARLALAVATRVPLLGLVLESGRAGLRDEGDRAARRTLDEQRARDLEERGKEAFFVDWDAQPLFKSLAARADVVERRRALRAAHDAHRLAAALRAFSPGAAPFADAHALAAVGVPTLLIAGDDDAVFKAEARALAALLPSARLAVMQGCGHAPHLEDPRAVAAALTTFQQEHT